MNIDGRRAAELKGGHHVDLAEAKRRKTPGLKFSSPTGVFGQILAERSPRGKLQADLTCAEPGCANVHTREQSDWHQCRRCRQHARGEASSSPKPSPRARGGGGKARPAADDARGAIGCVPLLTQGQSLDPLPDVLVHADWSFDTEPKRQWVRALRDGDGYVAEAPRPIGAVKAWLDELVALARSGRTVLAGFDFAMGVPAAFAAAAPRMVNSFVELLNELPPTVWMAGDDPQAVSWERPFFANSPKGWLALDALLHPDVPRSPKRRTRGGGGSTPSPHTWIARKLLGQADATESQLLRQCEHRHARRPEAASALFLLSGARQVGKASLSGWREIVLPALRWHREHVNLWPFDGPLHELVRPGKVTLVETYPAEAYVHLGIANKDKRRQEWRRTAGELMLRTVAGKNVGITAELETTIGDGFGPSGDGEDPFDAVAGLLSMALIALGHDTAYEPVDPVVRKVEGWILGRPGATSDAIRDP